MKIEYNNLYTHFILTTLNREPVIPEQIRIRSGKYITGIVSNNSSRLYPIYANPKHVHFLVSCSPEICEERLATIVADSTELFINENKMVRGKFAWQQSASAFSVSKSDVDRVCNYILNQPNHHKRVSFVKEYGAFIKYYEKTIGKK